MLTAHLEDGTDLVEAVLDGAPDGPGIAVLQRLLTEAGERRGGARVLAEVRRYEDPSSAEDRQQLRRLAALPGLRRFAVVSADASFRAAADRLLSFLPVDGRAFESREDARAWLDA